MKSQRPIAHTTKQNHKFTTHGRAGRRALCGSSQAPSNSFGASTIAPLVSRKCEG